MIPIKPLSEHPDAASKHVAGSQEAADERIAANMRKAARRRSVSVVLTGAMLEIVILACVVTFLLSVVIVFFTRKP